MGQFVADRRFGADELNKLGGLGLDVPAIQKFFPRMLASSLMLAGATLCAFTATPAPAAEPDLDEAILRLIEGDDAGVRTELPPVQPRPRNGAPGATRRDTGGAALTLAEAERAAIENDPSAKAASERAEAFEQQSNAAQRLADPRLLLGVNEYPTQPRPEGEDSVFLVLGIQQEVMPKSRRNHESAQMARMSEAQNARAQRQKLIALREARLAWFNVYLRHHSIVIIRQTQKILAQIQQIVQNRYRAGGSMQSDVLMAQLELSRMKDEEAEMEADREMAVAELAKWVGPAALTRSLSLDDFELPPFAERGKLEAALERHPALEFMQLEADAAREAVEVARSRGEAGYMLELESMWMYSSAEGTRSDSISAAIVVDLPFFKKNLQDRWLAASEKEYNSSQFLVADEKRDLKRMLDQELASWKRSDERMTFYRDVVLPQASQNAQAALRAYQSQVADFTQMMRARQMELESKLEALRLLVGRAMAHANILYLAGDGVSGQ